MPFYVSPEQVMKDRADYARKGIARGKSIVAVACAPGIFIMAENPSATLHKVSELYDRVAFAAVGKYNEFENLRIAGVRLADLRGFAYDREDVTAKAIANAYAQALGGIFTHEMKPYEVELLIVQVGETQDADEMYRVLYDGSVTDERGFVAMGGKADQLAEALRNAFRPDLDFNGALKACHAALGQIEDGRALTPGELEVAVLERDRPRRSFRRLSDQETAAALGA